MLGRLWNGIVVVFWMLAMTWLFAEKIIPPLLEGDPPAYETGLESAEQRHPPVAWKLRWKGQTIGHSANRLVPQADGGVDQQSYVEFQDLPLESLLSELLGPIAAVVKPFVRESEDLEVNLQIATRLRFDENQQLSSFETVIDLYDYENFLRVDGVVDDGGQMNLVAQMSGNSFSKGREFRHSVQLPPEALVEGSLSPTAQLKNLQTGQSWTIPVFRAFPPNSPVQIIQADVDKRYDIILWENDEVETFKIVYHAVAGSELNATRRPISCEWVRMDGTILRREIVFSGVELTFERQSESALDESSARLDELAARLWSAE